ncbi:MAG: hypothetical protein AMS21_10900 [Gemmatimonas sp. SG8_38_2]|nr:MAG: hypothetical protein AMS21_10900 [Gemmatimonas sp. SG8_38_2]
MITVLRTVVLVGLRALASRACAVLVTAIVPVIRWQFHAPIAALLVVLIFGVLMWIATVHALDLGDEGEVPARA